MAGYTTAVTMTKIFIVSRHISRIIIFNPIDNRLWVPKIRGEFKKYSFSTHVPIRQKSERQKNRLYETKEDVRKSSSAHTI